MDTKWPDMSEERIPFLQCDRKFDQHLMTSIIQSLALNYFKMKNQSTCDALKLFKHNVRSMCTFYNILSTFSNVSYVTFFN